MNKPAAIGHNLPPDLLDEALAPYSDTIAEAEAWLEGKPVENEDQMRAVDALLKSIKDAAKAVDGAKDAEAKPLHDAWKAALARYKPTVDDLERIKKGLVALVDAFKRKLAAEKAEAERKARAEAEAAMRAAQEAARAADASNIEAQRAAAEAQYEAEKAAARAAAASKDTVKGLRTTTMHEIEDYRAALHWIASNDRQAVTDFVTEYVRRHHKEKPIAGVRVWQEKVAF
jgi:hypothetical protein